MPSPNPERPAPSPFPREAGTIAAGIGFPAGTRNTLEGSVRPAIMAVTFGHIAEPGPDECTARPISPIGCGVYCRYKATRSSFKRSRIRRLSCGSSILAILFLLFLRRRWNAGLRDEPLTQAWMALRETVRQELEAARQELAGAA